MGDIMAKIAWMERIWKINMLGTIQSNQIGALMSAYLKANPTKKETHAYKIWQHNNKPLVADVWLVQKKEKFIVYSLLV